MKKYKIAIDVSPLSDGNSVRGVGFYTKNLVNALQAEIKSNPDFQDFNIELITDSSKLLTGFDLIHYPYFDPFYLTLPLSKTPFIVTVHDLIPIELANIFPVGIKGALKWQIQKYKLKKAKYILAPTHTAKYSIHSILNYSKEKIFTTYEAADSNFKKITDKKLLDNIKNKFNLPDKFVLFVGDLNTNKNIPRLAMSCNKLKIPLIIAGSSAVKKVLDHPWNVDIKWVQANQSKYLKSIGFVENIELPVLYNLASVYCQPSIMEGFGLPLLEAMQCGTPTCFSKQTSLAEISEYSGLSFDPYSVDDIVSKIKLLLSDKKLQQDLINKGKKRAKIFSWKTCAINTLAVYKLCQLDAQK